MKTSLASRFHLHRVGDRWLGILFHHVTDDSRWRADNPLTSGLDIHISEEAFRKRLNWLIDRYDVVSLDAILESSASRTARRKLLISFDDGYASVKELAFPVLRERNVPWCLFINPGFVGNTLLPLDNIIAYIANVHGLKPLSDVSHLKITSSHDFINRFLSEVPPTHRRQVVEDLASTLGIDTAKLAAKSKLFLNAHQIRELADAGVEIGNHTFNHVHCRVLDREHAKVEIKDSAAKVAEMSGKPVRAFAYPYGNIRDATAVTRRALQESGHKCAFLVHDRTNSARSDPFTLFRIGLKDPDDPTAAVELEILPRIRNAISKICSSLSATVCSAARFS